MSNPSGLGALDSVVPVNVPPAEREGVARIHPERIRYEAERMHLSYDQAWKHFEQLGYTMPPRFDEDV